MGFSWIFEDIPILWGSIETYSIYSSMTMYLYRVETVGDTVQPTRYGKYRT
jgi:hypothetical protein